MNQINQKLCIITDLDGTLLPASKIPLQRDLQAIRKFEQSGGVFTVATGRTVQASQHYIELLTLKSPMIVFNGAMIYYPDSGERLILQALPEKAKAMTAEIFREQPHAGIEVLCAEDTWVVNNTDTEKEHIQICQVTPKYGNVEEIEGIWLKVLFSMFPEDIPAFMDYIKDKHFQHVDFIRSEKKFYEMLPQNISKGSALSEYRRLSGMEEFKFIAVGDYDNDIEMLKAADFAVCPANAAESVKAVSDLILSRTCEEGAMEELIMKLLHQEIMR